MQPDAIASRHSPIETSVAPLPNKSGGVESNRESLFEHVAWAYALCREHLFRDDTERMIAVLWPDRRPAPGTKLIELGCGPGFYSCRLANRFRDISVMGVDRSESQLQWARERAAALVSGGRLSHSDSVPTFHHSARAEPRRSPNVSCLETRWPLLHCGTALRILGFDSTFRNVVNCGSDSI